MNSSLHAILNQRTAVIPSKIVVLINQFKINQIFA